MASLPDEVLVEFGRLKLTRGVLKVTKSNIVASVEAVYRKQSSHTVKSKEQRVTPGCIFSVPYSETISGLRIHIFSVNEQVTCYMGTAETESIEGLLTYEPKAVAWTLYHSGQPSGKVFATISVRQIFQRRENKSLKSRNKSAVPQSNAEPSGCAPASEGFRFSRLRRPINWERLRSINLRS